MMLEIDLWCRGNTRRPRSQGKVMKNLSKYIFENCFGFFLFKFDILYNSFFFFFFRSVSLLVLSVLSLLSYHWIIVWLLLWPNMVSFTHGASPQDPFLNILFSTFSDTIQSNFGPNFSLATVLAILFTLIENPDLLNLHFRQKNPQYSGENRSQHSGWIIALGNALAAQLGNKRTDTLFSGKIGRAHV